MGAERTLVVRGMVRTLDPARPAAGSVTVRGGRIESVQDDPPAAGAPFVLPAFTDAHVHFPSWALARRELRLVEARSLAQAVDLAARVAATVPRGGWLRGRGWRDELWPAGERPDRHALDAVTGDVPAALRAHDGHSLWLNSAALARAGGDLAVPGGVVETDDAGEPTGILREEAAWRFFDRHAAAGHDETLAAMRAALGAVAGAGVTAIHDKDGGRDAPELFAALRSEGPLPLRVWQSIPVERLGEIAADYVKAFMDGTLGSRTARLLDGSGVQITSTAGLAHIIRRAARAGLPVAVHAIGDLANREALEAFEATAADWRGLRPRIEHAQCVAPEDLPRFAALGVTASVQYTHATSDRELAARLWADRLDHAYPYRALLDAGARLAGGSDAPVEELDPLAGLAAAAECDVPLDAALESFTVQPAWLSGDEDLRGRLQPGFDADLVVLDRDPLEDPGSATVLGTMLAGEWIYGPAW